MPPSPPTEAQWRAWSTSDKEALLGRLRVKVRRPWRVVARDKQVAPEWPWAVWVILAGRGWGKTRTGAEWVAECARAYPGCRIALVAQTFADGRDTMVEGESGLLSVLADEELRDGSRERGWNRSLGELYLANGSRFKIFSSEKPHRLRGPQHHFVWGDEPATWYDAHRGPAEDTTWSNLEIGCRVSINGSQPQIVVTGTPRPVRLLTQRDREPLGLLLRESTALTRGHTDENLPNLASTYRERVVDPIRNTRLGRQELAAEILEDVEGALWQSAQLDVSRVLAPPRTPWRRVVVGLDPADGTGPGDEQAIVVAGANLDMHFYVLHSEGMRTRPWDYLSRAIDLAIEHEATIVVEKNHGGAYLVELLEQVLRARGVRVPYRVINAGTGKLARAEPVAALYEPAQAKVHHVGHHAELEEQMTSYTAGSGEPSPDRMDALVHALRDLMGLGWHSPPSSVDIDAAVPYTDQAGVEGAVAWR